MRSDTHPAAERALIALLREATVAQRGSRMLALSATVKELSLRAVARANPGDSEQEVRLKWAELHYGKDLADRVRAYLAARSCNDDKSAYPSRMSESIAIEGQEEHRDDG